MTSRIEPSEGPGHSRVEEGICLDGTDRPAWQLWSGGERVPVLVSAPHGGAAYSAALLARMRHPGQVAMRLEDRHTALLASQVARQCGAALMVAHAPRALIDLNRAADDLDWGMISTPGQAMMRHSSSNRRARSGLGIVPRRLAGLGEIWRGRLALAELEARIADVHQPYHAALARALERMRDRWGAVLLVDLHSMPPLGAGDGARMVIGDRYGSACDPALVEAASEALDVAGYRHAINQPYAGGYILERQGAPRRGIHALQLEVCRTLYLDADRSAPGDGFADVADRLAELVRHLAMAVGRIARPLWREAAE